MALSTCHIITRNEYCYKWAVRHPASTVSLSVRQWAHQVRKIKRERPGRTLRFLLWKTSLCGIMRISGPLVTYSSRHNIYPHFTLQNFSVLAFAVIRSADCLSVWLWLIMRGISANCTNITTYTNQQTPISLSGKVKSKSKCWMQTPAGSLSGGIKSKSGDA